MRPLLFVLVGTQQERQFERLRRLWYHDCGMEISISFDKRFPGCPRADWLRNVVRKTLRAEGVAPGTVVSLVITGQERIQELNRDYLGEDRPTDVLSFSMLDGPPAAAFPTPPDGSRQLGEVLVSFPQAALQAQQRGHPVERELAILIIHGILHLLGYDHEKPPERRVMRRREKAILELIEGAAG